MNELQAALFLIGFATVRLVVPALSLLLVGTHINRRFANQTPFRG
jgi:hypothetical protein